MEKFIPIFTLFFDSVFAIPFSKEPRAFTFKNIEYHIQEKNSTGGAKMMHNEKESKLKVKRT